ncbi:hypothetical protein J2857_001944 [Neorhizobium galegae]|uniref:hypothetical protein n=1 Tax=Neorhizobium galegae TaxID=399 RepID=UPI001AEAA778|nr:hypothetical protein [Neorhizobium galegae]MBP2559193.1 hypothetical protein [Neorhizobium galegae]
MRAFVVAKDGTTDDLEGNRIFFSFQNFKEQVCVKGSCFVCGAPHSRKKFNDEHVFPDWVIRRCGLQNSKFTLTNGELVPYTTYKIPCCQTCNTQLSAIYETPISKAFHQGYEGLLKFMQDGNASLIKAWLSLIFLKVHLRDFKNKVVLDERLKLGMIGDHYDLHELHHIHAVARAATAGVAINDNVFGTLAIFKIESSEDDDGFDYCDSLTGRGLLLRINDIALLHILDDCGGTAGMLSKRLEVLPHPLSQLQLREVYAHHIAANVHIRNRPVFRTEVPLGKQPQISVELPDFELHEYDPSVFGSLFAGVIGTMIAHIVVDGAKGDEALEKIATGQVSFIFDENGNVRRESSGRGH